MNRCGIRKYNSLYCRWISIKKFLLTSHDVFLQLTFHLITNERIRKSNLWNFSVSGSVNDIKIKSSKICINSEQSALYEHLLSEVFKQTSFLEVNIKVTMSAALPAQPNTDEIVLDMNPQYKKIISNNKRILTESKYSDFTFVVQGTEFKVHKGILSAASPVFDKLFSTKLIETYTNDCHVPHIEPLIFQYLMSFIYSGELPENLRKENVARKLFEAAHYYQIENLIDVCKQTQHFKLSVENAEEMYNWAVTYELDDVKTDAWNIIRT